MSLQSSSLRCLNVWKLIYSLRCAKQNPCQQTKPYPNETRNCWLPRALCWRLLSLWLLKHWKAPLTWLIFGCSCWKRSLTGCGTATSGSATKPNTRRTYPWSFVTRSLLWHTLTLTCSSMTTSAYYLLGRWVSLVILYCHNLMKLSFESA